MECKLYGANYALTHLPSEPLSFLKQLKFNPAAQDPEEVTYEITRTSATIVRN
jgi:hypothetical protein